MFVRGLATLGVGKVGSFGRDGRARLPGRGNAMRSNVKLLSVAALVWLVSAPAWAQAGKCEVVLGSLAAQLDPAQGWLGQGYLSFGHDDPIATNLVDEALAPGQPNKAGGLSGEEKLTFTVPGGDTVVMTVRYWGSAKQVPFLNEYIASGNISGTGAFRRATGNVNIHGQYVFDPQVFTGGPPRAWPFVWMAEIHGVICGRK